MTALTAEEMGRLLVAPSAVQGLVPIGLRVVSPGGRSGWVVPFGLHSDRYQIATPDGLESGTECIDWDDLDDKWSYDLQDASTADRVARWLAARVGLEVGCTAPGWYYHEGGWYLAGDECWTGIPSLAAAGNYVAGLPFSERRLGELADHRRLPDGSRYVDRLALALVAVHVGRPTEEFPPTLRGAP